MGLAQESAIGARSTLPDKRAVRPRRRRRGGQQEGGKTRGKAKRGASLFGVCLPVAVSAADLGSEPWLRCAVAGTGEGFAPPGRLRVGGVLEMVGREKAYGGKRVAGLPAAWSSRCERLQSQMVVLAQCVEYMWLVYTPVGYVAPVATRRRQKYIRSSTEIYILL